MKDIGHISSYDLDILLQSLVPHVLYLILNALTPLNFHCPPVLVASSVFLHFVSYAVFYIYPQDTHI
jgi:hypothetical protein